MKAMLHFAKLLLEHKTFPLIIAIIAFIISIPTINGGLFADDLIHRAVLVDADKLPPNIYKTGLQHNVPGKLSSAVFKLFCFSNNDKGTMQASKYGTLPWWITKPHDFKVAFWRPLSSLTHWLDYRLFPDNTKYMHIHHLLWFSAVIFLIAFYYRRLIGPTWIAALAAVMFLIDENNFFPVMLVAHRNSIMALFFGLNCVLCHHSWRENRSITAATLSAVLLLLSLLCAEAGIATFAFILAYAIALEKDKITKRVMTIVPAVITIILWRIVYNYLGYGIENVGIYVDPVSEPLRFTAAAFVRFSVLLFGIFFPVSPDATSSLSPSALTWFITVSIVSLLILLSAMLWLLKNNRIALYLALSTIFACIPFCACFSSGRNLLFASVPAFGLIAIFITDIFKRAVYLPKPLLLRIFVWIICIVLLINHLPVALAGKAVSQKFMVAFFSCNIEPPDIFAQNISRSKSLVIINSPSLLGTLFIPFYQAYNVQELPKTIRPLTPAFRDIQITRTDESTLVIKSIDGNIFSCNDIGPLHIAYGLKMFCDLFRDKDTKFSLDEEYEFPEVTIKVIKTDNNSLPVKISYTFSKSLEDKSLDFYYYNWDGSGHQKFEIPAVGQTVTIKGPSYADFSVVINYIKWQMRKMNK